MKNPLSLFLPLQCCPRQPGSLLHHIFRVSFFVPASLAAPRLLTPVLCKHRQPPTSRLLLNRSHDWEVVFDWNKFWEYLSPEWLWLLLAVAVSFYFCSMLGLMYCMYRKPGTGKNVSCTLGLVIYGCLQPRELWFID